MNAVLTWEEPPKEQPHEAWAAYQADGAPPGTYQPNMDDGWKLKWKATLHGQRSGPLRVEIRKTVGITRGGSVQVLVIAHEDGYVSMSMNGTACFEETVWSQLPTAVSEARDVMRRWRERHSAAPTAEAS